MTSKQHSYKWLNRLYTSQSLNLRGKRIDAEGAAAIANALQSDTCHLTELHLGYNSIGDEGAAAIANALQSDTCHLTELHLGDNSIGDEGAAAIANALQSDTCHLTELDLGDNSIGAEGAAAIANALQSDTCHLTVLNLWFNHIGDEGAAAIANALQSDTCHLTVLYLGFNSICDEGAAAIANALQSDTCHLTMLNLRGNCIGDEGAAAVANALKHNHTLSHLDLSYNNIKYFPIEVTFHWFERCSVDLSDNHEIRSPPLKYANDPQALKEYLREASRSSSPLDTIHIVLLGRGGVGKTQFKSIGLKREAMLGNDPDLWAEEEVDCWLDRRGLSHILVDAAIDQEAEDDQDLGPFWRVENLAEETRNELLLQEVKKIRRDCTAIKRASKGQPVHVSTKGIEYDVVSLNSLVSNEVENNNNINLNVVDLAGQPEYYVTHSLFLRKHIHGLYVVVVNMYYFDEMKCVYVKNEQWQQHLHHWLRFVRASIHGWDRVPVLTLLTHGDCLEVEHENDQVWINGATQIISEYRVDSVGCFVVGYSSHQQDNGRWRHCEDLRWPLDRIRRCIHDWSTMYASKVIVPQIYQQVESGICARYEEMMNRRELPLIDSATLRTLAHECLPADRQGDDGVCVRSIEYLDTIGVVYVSGGLHKCVLSPFSWLPHILCVFVHDDATASQIKQVGGIVQHEHLHTKYAYRLLHCESSSEVDEVMQMLIEFGLCFEVDGVGYAFPAMLPAISRLECMQRWHGLLEDCGERVKVCGRRWKSSCALPPALFPSLQVQHNGGGVLFQGQGCLILGMSEVEFALIRWNVSESCIDLLLIHKSLSCEFTLLEPLSSSIVVALRNFGIRARGDVHNFLYRTDVFDSYALCSRCIARQQADPCTFRFEVSSDNDREFTKIATPHAECYCQHTKEHSVRTMWTHDQLLRGCVESRSGSRSSLEEIDPNDLDEISRHRQGSFCCSFIAMWKDPNSDSDPVKVVLRVPREESRIQDAELWGDLQARLMVQHENVFPVLGYCRKIRLTVDGEEADRACIVLPYSEYDLRMYVLLSYAGMTDRDTSISEREVLAIGLDIARGLEFLHSQDCVHRDLKCDNVLRTARGWALNDFGVLRRLFGETYSIDRLVPTHWLPPEALPPNYHHSRKSDVWMFALTMWEVITKCQVRSPYADLGVGEVLDDAAQERVKSGALENVMSSLSSKNCVEGFRGLLKECVSVDEDSRPTATEIVKRLEELLSDPYEHGEPPKKKQRMVQQEDEDAC